MGVHSLGAVGLDDGNLPAVNSFAVKGERVGGDWEHSYERSKIPLLEQMQRKGCPV